MTGRFGSVAQLGEEVVELRPQPRDLGLERGHPSLDAGWGRRWWRGGLLGAWHRLGRRKGRGGRRRRSPFMR